MRWHRQPQEQGAITTPVDGYIYIHIHDALNELDLPVSEHISMACLPQFAVCMCVELRAGGKLLRTVTVDHACINYRCTE